MTFPTMAAALRAYYTAMRGGVRAARLEPREADERRPVSDGRMVEIAAIGRALAGAEFDEVDRALLQWWNDPYYEERAWTWAEVKADLPALGMFHVERQARSSFGGRGLRERVKAALEKEWVVR